ncbi:MAG: STAS domain-containing protein [Candidatus Eisenbacteria bacterium]|nr:STAS domain-containing protein [Candidatus Eisenbacteria bacterium]
MALNLELSHGRPGASARVEIHERPDGRIALLELHGWIEAVAVHRLGAALDDLASRGVTQLLLDCSHLRHIDYRHVPTLVASLGRFESRAGGTVVCGLSPYLRDLFRLAGCEPDLRCWPSADELLRPRDFEPSGERAS